MLFSFFLFQFYSVVYSIASKRSPEPWGDTLKSIDDNARDFKWPDRHEKGTWAAVAATGEGSRARAETGVNREEGSGMEEEEDSHIVRAEALSEREGGVAVAAANKGQTQKTSDDDNDYHDGAHQQVVVMARGGEDARAKAEASGGPRSVVETRISDNQRGGERLALGSAIIHRQGRRRGGGGGGRNRNRQRGKEEQGRGRRPIANDKFHPRPPQYMELNNRQKGNEQVTLNNNVHTMSPVSYPYLLRKQVGRECFCTC